jgi:hypothetical protein
MPIETEDAFAWLSGLPKPRPLVWQPFVYRRRAWFGFLCVLLLLLAVGIPIYHGLDQMTADANQDRIKFNHIAIILGAAIVVGYVVFVHSLFRLYDDVKWLAQRGSIAEANILLVFRGSKKLIVSYRFWDDKGKELERDAVIDVDETHPVHDLQPGMVVPILYDPVKPETRSYLWAEAATYLTEKLPEASL